MKVHRSFIIRRTINTVVRIFYRRRGSENLKVISCDDLSTFITAKIFIRDSLRILVLLSFPKCRSSDLTLTISASKIQPCKVALSMSPLAGPGEMLSPYLSALSLPPLFPYNITLYCSDKRRTTIKRFRFCWADFNPTSC